MCFFQTNCLLWICVMCSSCRCGFGCRVNSEGCHLSYIYPIWEIPFSTVICGVSQSQNHTAVIQFLRSISLCFQTDSSWSHEFESGRGLKMIGLRRLCWWILMSSCWCSTVTLRVKMIIKYCIEELNVYDSLKYFQCTYYVPRFFHYFSDTWK